MEEKIALGINPISNKSFTVMIADDSNVERALLKRFLLSEQFEITHESPDGEDLLFYLNSSLKKPDIVCVDLNMPKKNGLQVIQELKKTYPEIKTIVISSLNDKPIIQALTQLKVNAYIMKPYNRTQVLEKFANLVGKNLNEKMSEEKKINLNDLNVPPMQAVAMKVITFDSSNPTGGSEELERIISPDKSITADIMKIANSAYYGRAGNVKSLKDAITLLGVKTVKNLIILQSNKKYAQSLNKPIYTDLLQKFPILMSLIASDLTSPLNLKKIKDEVFITTLLRKVGMTILGINFNDSYSEILEASLKDERSLLEHEMNKYSVNHIQVGMRVFKLWNMPLSLQDSMAKQNFRIEDIATISDIDRVSKLAEFFAKRLMGYNLKEDEKKAEQALFIYYKVSEEMKQAFAGEYYEMIQDHPFFEMLA
jgi:HD-like signal output (HDOD) protein